MVISLALVNNIHQLMVINWFLPCSTSKNLFTWLESYRLGLAWRPWAVRLHHYIFLSSGCGWRSFEVLTRIHIVCLVVVFSIWGQITWIYSVCFVAMFFLLHYLFMDLQCIIGSHDIVIIMDLQCIGLQPWSSRISHLLVLCQLWGHLSLPLYQIDIFQTISPITFF